ncbi:MAG TPA: hypothetical protein VHD61_15675 [Lacunisphaera sp.]|nr:hypothetical protein [Lacunisphaera sp.]
MAADDNLKLSACLQRLRRQVDANTLTVAALKQAIEDAYAEAGEQVTITATSNDVGGQASGLLTFDKWLFIAAGEALLIELGESVEPPPRGSFPDHSGHYVEA